MIKTGMCSVSFRKLTLEQIVELVKKAGLDAIEWGGDVHVPHGDLKTAHRALQLTCDAGLEISSYGSYVSPLDADGKPEDFAPVLESALALETKTVRVWAGRVPSAQADQSYRCAMADSARQMAESAQAHQIRLAFEFHCGSLTDTNESAQQLLREVNHPNCYMYWQPSYEDPQPDYRLAGLQALRERVLNLHVYHWNVDPSIEDLGASIDRRPLADGAEEWTRYLSVPLAEELPHYALMEFVRDDRPEQLVEDAAVLRRLVDSAGASTA
jgi:sugar phosphate isomerase/epimerase